MCLEIDWSTIKDIALVALSAFTLLSTIFTKRRDRTEKWINDFREQVSKVIALYGLGMTSSIELTGNFIGDMRRRDELIKKELSQAAFSVMLLLDVSKEDHLKLNAQMVYLNDNLDSDNAIQIQEVITLARKIIEARQGDLLNQIIRETESK